MEEFQWHLKCQETQSEFHWDKNNGVEIPVYTEHTSILLRNFEG